MVGDCSSEVIAAILGILYAMNRTTNDAIWTRFYDESTFKPISNKGNDDYDEPKRIIGSARRSHDGGMCDTDHRIGF